MLDRFSSFEWRLPFAVRPDSSHVRVKGCGIGDEFAHVELVLVPEVEPGVGLLVGHLGVNSPLPRIILDDAVVLEDVLLAVALEWFLNRVHQPFGGTHLVVLVAGVHHCFVEGREFRKGFVLADRVPPLLEPFGHQTLPFPSPLEDDLDSLSLLQIIILWLTLRHVLIQRWLLDVRFHEVIGDNLRHPYLRELPYCLHQSHPHVMEVLSVVPSV